MINSVMPTRWRLKQFLDARNITVYKLATETKGRLSRTSLYKLTNDEPAQVRRDTFDALIPALERLTGERVDITDLLYYERD